MSNGILDLMADTAVGMFSGNRRLENFEQREKTREDFAPGEMRDFSYNRYMQAFKEARDAAFADSLASDLKTTALGSAVAPYQETYGLVESLIPGGVKPLSEEEREIFQSRRIKTPVDMEFLEEQLGAPPTEEDIKAAEEFIYQNSPTSNISYALGLIAEVKAPALFLTKYGPKALKAMYNFIKQKPKTTAAGAAAATVGTSSEAEALPFSKASAVGKGATKTSKAQSKIEEAASTFTKKINTSELNKLLSKKIPNFIPIDPRKFAPSQQKVNLYENLRTILIPVSDPNRKIGVSYKNPTQKDIEKIKEIYKNRGQAPIATKTVNNINTLRANDKFNDVLNSGKLPD